MITVKVSTEFPGIQIKRRKVIASAISSASSFLLSLFSMVSRKHSAIRPVHIITNLIRRAFDNEQYCSGLFIDISQVFDKVWHEGLLFKVMPFLPTNVHKLIFK